MVQRQTKTPRLKLLLQIVGVVLTATGCDGGADSTQVSDSEIGIMSAAATAANVCGDRCGTALLAPGQACCTTGSNATPYDVATQCCTLGVQNKYPIQNIGDCPARKFHPSSTNPNEQDPPTQDGCSDLIPLALNALAPGVVPLPPGIETFILGVANNAFRRACNNHDTCYGTCDTSPARRAQCDDKLRSEMRQTCQNNRLLRIWPAYGLCVSAAQIMYLGVSAGGGPLYDRAQRGVDGHGGCDCCVGDTSCALGNADLNVTSLAIPPNPVQPGNAVQFQFDINNTGPEAATSLTARLDFTAGLSQPTPVVYAAGTAPVPCIVTALVGGGSLATCTVALLDVGGAAVIKGSATTATPGQESAFASVSAIQSDPNQFDNADSANWLVACPQGTTWNLTTKKCECTPLTSAQACLGGQDCDYASDGCGGQVGCGTCTAPETCGGGGVRNRCGCPQGQVKYQGACVDYLGAYQVNYYEQAAGCYGTGLPQEGNPYECVGGAPYYLTAAPGTYVIETVTIGPTGPGNARAWSGDATGGTGYYLSDSPGGTVTFTHTTGQLVLYAWDWYRWDNSPNSWQEVQVYRVGP